MVTMHRPSLLVAAIILGLLQNPLGCAAQRPAPVSINSTVEQYASVGSGVSSLVNFLIYIAVGDLAFSVLMIILLILPFLLDKSARARRVVVSAVNKKVCSIIGNLK